MTNRIGLLMYNPDRARKLKWAVGIAIGIINISVFCIWIPARLQISKTYIRANHIWDRAEKCIFLLIDAFLNIYFMYLIKTKLVANGLVKYKLVYQFNLVMVIFSLSLDVSHPPLPPPPPRSRMMVSDTDHLHVGLDHRANVLAR